MTPRPDRSEHDGRDDHDGRRSRRHRRKVWNIVLGIFFFILGVIGILIPLLGLVIVGMSGTRRGAPTNARLPIGLLLMAVGILMALLATQVALMLGLEHPG